MSKKLVIVESPSKTKTISKLLGDDYKVVSSKGHIRDLATTGKEGLGVDVEGDFEAKYVVSRDKKDVVKELHKHAEDADKIYLATDPDREGEAISWHLANELDIDIDQENRVVFNEITKDAIQAAFESPRKIDMDLVHSQETRRILDRIIGFKLSKLLKSKIRSKSAGRVQSVALKIIVEREKEIKAFKPVEYWSIKALFNENNEEFEAELSKISNKKAKVHNKDEADTIVKAVEKDLELANITSRNRRRQPKLVFITSTLQQEAANKLNFNARKTMRVAQKLYEGIDLGNGPEGLITYMRTDSTRLSQGFVQSALSYIENNYGKKYVGKYRFSNKSENTEDAHEGIRMTQLTHTPQALKTFLTPDEFKLYSLIYYRTLASLMAAARVETTTYTFVKDIYELSASGTQIVFDGYLNVYKAYEQANDTFLPALKEKEIYQPQKVEGKQHFTEPPLRYNEARLIKAMEELGIGRPSTYAFIMDTIVSRGYVQYMAPSEGSRAKVFIPTDQGFLTDEKLAENFSTVINVEYTAKMEEELDKISQGQLNHVEELRDFYDRFQPLVDKAYETMEKEPLKMVGETCPECGGNLVYRHGRYGEFIACDNFPTCKYNRPLPGKEKKPAVKTGEMCPECGHELVERISRYKTKFVGCSNFPKCRYIKPDPNKKKKVNKDEPKES